MQRMIGLRGFRFSPIILETTSRSRDHDCSQPPPRIRTGGFPASGSGPMWVATPLSCDFFIHYNLAGLTGAQENKHENCIEMDSSKWGCVFGGVVVDNFWAPRGAGGS